MLANRTAFERFSSASPTLWGVDLARHVIPELGERTILHAGPPVAWADMCGPMQGAIIGAVLYEGWAPDVEAAKVLAASTDIHFAPAHHYAAVGPMAGIISPNMPVWSVENSAHGNRAYSTLNEGLGNVLRFGANGPEVIERLRWMREVLAPALQRTLEVSGPMELKPLMAQALHMGDEVHNRNVAASALLLKRIAPALVRTGLDSTTVASVIEFIADNDHFSSIYPWLRARQCSTPPTIYPIVRWSRPWRATALSLAYVSAAQASCGTPRRLLLSKGSFSQAIHRTMLPEIWATVQLRRQAGLGGFAMAAAPAIVQFVGGSPETALAYSEEMGYITISSSSAFTLPALDFHHGSPAGIDCRKVLDTGIAPIINTGIAHREPGVGQIGAGIVRAPLICFVEAVAEVAQRLVQSGLGGAAS